MPPAASAVPAARGGGLCCKSRFILKKLFTKEDPVYLHKVLGLAALLSFAHRYAWVYPRRGALGLADSGGGAVIAWATMALHMALSTSSLIFHVLARRIFNKPMIIWEEYRLHAIVFTLRCVSVFAFGRLWAAVFPEHTTLHRMAFYPLVMSHHLVVDEITRRYGDKDRSKTTVRSGLDATTTPLWKIVVLRGYSFYQFAALGSHLVPPTTLDSSVADCGFNTLIAIQSSAFLMTLFRKNLIKAHSHALWYTLALLVSGFHIFRMHPGWGFFGKLVLAFLLRTRLRVDKYIIWFLFVVASLPRVEQVATALATRVLDVAREGDAAQAWSQLSLEAFGGSGGATDLYTVDAASQFRKVLGMGVMLAMTMGAVGMHRMRAAPVTAAGVTAAARDKGKPGKSSEVALGKEQ